MQFSVFFAALCATVVAASPLDLPVPPRQATYSVSPTSTLPPYPYPTNSYDACPDGLYSVAQCCATDILGVADLNCGSLRGNSDTFALLVVNEPAAVSSPLLDKLFSAKPPLVFRQWKTRTRRPT
ncbi:hypothetical protein F4802DRAFT_601742 [Xylaria palmicola]|nr:hypothetical protein F4802DRAFT_601742 [Xylaria palmicola]